MSALAELRKMRGLSALLWPHTRGDRGLLALGGGASLLLILLRVAHPWPLKWIIDLLTNRREHAAFGGLLAPPSLGPGGLSLLYVAITVLAATVAYTERLVLAGLGNRVIYRLRTALFGHVLAQSIAFHESRSTGELLTRIVYDTARLRQGVIAILMRIFQTAGLFLATLAVLLWLNSRLALVVAAGALLALGAMAWSGGRIARASRKQRKKEGRLASTVAEDLLGVRELQTYRAGRWPDDRFGRKNVKSLVHEQRVRQLAAWLVLRIEILVALTITGIIWVGAQEVQAGVLTPGDLVLFVSYAAALYRPLEQFARQTYKLGKTAASGDRLRQIMAETPAIADRPGAIPVTALHGDLAFEDISVKTPKEVRSSRKHALSAISFALAGGERVAILGGNGAGKSTLLRTVLRFVDPDNGRVLLDGRDLRDYTVESVRRQISVVFQENVFFGLSVQDNIALGDPAAAIDDVRRAAERARIDKFIERLPAGYATPIRRGGELFSGGERQRIAIARALQRNGRIWLLDEPTRGIDPATAADLTTILLGATEGRTTLWVTHDPAVLPLLDRVVVLKQGALQFTGTPVEYGDWLAERVSTRSSPLTGES
ncbi:MAG TPA: ABC transporter ATP-binding protein [Gemmatimonadales bacterium]|nr:ABC transporter ATP-binding protein [Gemmatimonadales bacterium]